MAHHTIVDTAGIEWSVCSETGLGKRITPFAGGPTKRRETSVRHFPVVDPKAPNDLSGIPQAALTGMAGAMLRWLLACGYNSAVDATLELRHRFKDQPDADRVAAVEAYRKARL